MIWICIVRSGQRSAGLISILDSAQPVISPFWTALSWSYLHSGQCSAGLISVLDSAQLVLSQFWTALSWSYLRSGQRSNGLFYVLDPLVFNSLTENLDLRRKVLYLCLSVKKTHTVYCSFFNLVGPVYYLVFTDE